MKLAKISKDTAEVYSSMDALMENRRTRVGYIPADDSSEHDRYIVSMISGRWVATQPGYCWSSVDGWWDTGTFYIFESREELLGWVKDI